jgi:hypothetical protein
MLAASAAYSQGGIQDTVTRFLDHQVLSVVFFFFVTRFLAHQVLSIIFCATKARVFVLLKQVLLHY